MDKAVSGFLSEAQSWGRERRRDQSVRKSLRPVAFTFLVIIMLVSFYLFFVWSRLWVIDLGYRISKALKEQSDLIKVNHRLRIERATLISPERIRSDAEKRLGMGASQGHQIRYIP